MNKEEMLNMYLDFLDDEIDVKFEELPIPKVSDDYDDIELDMYYSMCKVKSAIENK